MAKEAQDLWVERVLGVSAKPSRSRRGGFGGGKSGKTRTVPNPPEPVQRFKIGTKQMERANSLLDMMSDEERQVVDGVLDKLDTSSGDLDGDQKELLEIKRNYIYKAVASDRSPQEIADFYDRIKDQDKEWIQQNLHVVHGSKGKGIKQQWQMSYGPTTLQAFRAEMDPIYALQLHHENEQLSKSTMVSGSSRNPNMAQEQKDILEKFGGRANARGSIFGALANLKKDGGMDIEDALNKREFKNYLGLTCKSTECEDNYFTAVYGIIGSLDRGQPVPIRVEGKLGGHFALITGYDGQGDDARFSVHDPWAGAVVVVTAKQIKDKKVNFAMCTTLTHIFTSEVLDPSKDLPDSAIKRHRQQMRQKREQVLTN